jgi:HPt (histidine-containing phosphotransfer) domain-containing protein
MQDNLIYSIYGGEADMAKIVAEFIEGIPRRVKLMEQSWADADWETFTRVVHQLKGAASSYGYQELTPPLISLHKAAKDQDDNAIGVSLAEVRSLCGRIRAGAPDNDFCAARE